MVSVFTCLDKSLTPKKSVDVNVLLNYIKNSSHKDQIVKARELGKHDQNLSYTDKIWKSFSKTKKAQTGKAGEYVKVQRNLYNHVKSTLVPSVTWAGSFSLRNKSHLIDLSGYIFFDIDDFSTISIDQVRSILTDPNFTFIKAVWQSFGGNGLGFLVKVNGLTIDNFESTWTFVKDQMAKYNIKIDQVTKDFTRLSVLSYDPDIFIRNDEELVPINARTNVDQNKRQLNLVSDQEQNVELEEIYCNHIFERHFEDAYNWNISENRLSYVFFQKYFALTNLYGINLNTAHNFLVKLSRTNSYVFSYREDGEIYEIGEKQYNTYESQHGSILVDNIVNYDDNYKVLKYNVELDKSLASLKLTYLYNSFVRPKGDVRKMFYAFFAHCKNTGILPADVKAFLINQIGNIDDTINQLFIAVYQNIQIPFGLVLEETEASILAKREKFIAKQKSRGLQIIELKNNDGEYNNNSFIKEIYDSFVKNGVLDENAFYSLIKQLLSYGVDKSLVATFMSTQSKSGGNTPLFYLYLDELYKNLAYLFGLKIIKKFSNSDRNNLIKITKKISLPNDKKLSHLKLTLDDWSILWANTNMGKTTYICNDLTTKRIVLVPVIGALQAIEQKYGASVFFEHKKNVKPDDNLIVCTYSSFPKLLNKIKAWGNVAEYELYVDEMHNLAVSSNPNFRNKEMNFILDNIHLFKKRVLLTGTIYPIVHPVLSSFSVTRIDWEQPIVKNYSEIYYEDIFVSIEKRLVKGKKNIIYFQNKQHEGEMGKFILFLKEKGWANIQYINADEKYSDHFKRLIELERIDDDVEVLICTSIMVEALNILNEDVQTIHFMTFENPILLEQMVNRCRIKLPEDIYIYKKMKKSDHIEDDIDIIQLQKDLIKDSENLLRVFTPYSLLPLNKNEQKLLNKIRRDQLFQNNALIRKINDSYYVDYLAISNISLEEETSYAYKNSEYLQEILSEYSWKLKEYCVDAEKVDSELKATLKAFKEEKKAELQDALLKICEDINVEGEFVLNTVIKEDRIKQYDKLERGEKQVLLRLKVHSLLKYMDFANAINLVKYWIETYNFSEKAWNRIKRQVHLKSAVVNELIDVNLKDSTNKLLYKIYNEYKDHSFYEFELIKLFNSVYKESNKFQSVDDISKELIEYFEITTFITSNGKLKYKFGGLNPLRDINIQYNKIVEFATKAMKSSKQYTSKELYDELKKIRGNLPYVKQIPFKKKDALQIFRDHVEFEASSSKIISGKRERTYKFTSLVPKDISFVEIKKLEQNDVQTVVDVFSEKWTPIFQNQ